MKKILHSNILKQKNSQLKMKPPNRMYCQNTAELNFCCILLHKQHDFKVPFLRDTVQLNKKKGISTGEGGTGELQLASLPLLEGKKT